ncbi:MAG: nucleotidyltransferase family protein [Clostridiales bacterium]|nr:nucleotidyltransferase family protein [Clostridiales bacterium]
MMQNNVFELIKLSLWGEGSPTIDSSVYQEMKSQAIASLPAAVLSSFNLPPTLMKEWRYTIFQQIAHFEKYKYIQAHLPINVPYVILKGSSAAQYYPHPEYRAMGDIDVITRQEDYNTACETMLENTWNETTSRIDLERGRHRSFSKDGVIVEIHAFFASMNDINKAKAFDELILNHISKSHILPDLINGLVLIEHVNQHMEEGIGLRQIIDWMMFVDRCLTDDRWTEFETMAAQTGLKELAVTTTRMCEIYLGLPPHTWCRDADEKLSRILMEYIINCGDFGVKLNRTDALFISRLYQLRHPIMAIRDLQQKGCKKSAIMRSTILRPFAWIVEGGRHLCKTPHMMGKYRNARRINVLFKSLGISRRTDGLIFYKDGRYFKGQ